MNFSWFKKNEGKNILVIPEPQRDLTPEELAKFEKLRQEAKKDIWDTRYATSPCPIIQSLKK